MSFLFVAGMTHLHCIAHVGICTLQSYHLDIAYKWLMLDWVVLVGPCIWGLLNAGTNFVTRCCTSSTNERPVFKAILYGHTPDGVVQDWFTSFSGKLHQDIHMTFVLNPVSYLLSQWQSLHGPRGIAYCLHGCLKVFLHLCEFHIRIKSGEPGIPGFSMPGRLGGVICKPEGAAWGLVKTPPSLRARK